MKSELQEMVQELEKAFNETVCESGRIAEVLAGIKAAGYDVMLALDVTVGVNTDDPSADEKPAGDQAMQSEKKRDQVSNPVKPSNGELLLTAEDEEFLRGLQIGR